MQDKNDLRMYAINVNMLMLEKACKTTKKYLINMKIKTKPLTHAQTKLSLHTDGQTNP